MNSVSESSTREIAPPPYFDPVALRAELTAIYKSYDGAESCRPAVLKRLKALTSEARAAARARLMLDGNGAGCAEGLSHFQDELIRLIFDYTIHHVYHAATGRSDDEEMAVVATGGYGRGMLAPGSDIDLLFLLPYKQTPWVESVAEYMLYLLWDLGFKVGHATRTISQCVSLAKADSTIRTSLLDSRFILGDAKLYANFEQRFRENVVAGTAREFIAMKMAERDGRHAQTGESRYRVEPNVKDGKGGLRDLHTLHWLSKYVAGSGVGAETVADGTFTEEEAATFRRCRDFLWTVRCHLHFEAGRAEERLSFDMQPIIAKNLCYREGDGLRAVERFMRHYFLIAKDVGELTAILCANLEIQQLAQTPRLRQLINPLNWATRREVRRTTEFRIDDDRLNVSDKTVFERDPVNLLRIFLQAEQTGTFFHPEAIRLMRQSVRLIDDQVRNDSEANRIFLELLCSKKSPEASLRRMNESGVLGRFIPEFGLVVSMMQFNMYHHFTVDEHLVRTVGQLRAIEEGEVADETPLSSRIMSSIQNRRALYVAAFLHDVGKGRPEDHSIVGAEIAKELCPRLGLSKAETDTVSWLIREHLTMSDVAQRRDLSDPKTIRDFADVVQTPERLKLLLLLTVADIRAVGPGTWNGWKGQLLRELYYETELMVSGGHTAISRTARLEIAKQALRDRLGHFAPDTVEGFIERQYPDYWLKTDTDKQVEHAKLMDEAQRTGQQLATSFKSDAFKGMTELAILAPNHPRLLALFAGCCAAAGANIIGAQISSTRDGFALDTFLLQRGFEDNEDENRRTDRISKTIVKVLKGEARLKTLLAERRVPEARIHAFTVEPEIVISNALSDQFTVIEVAGLDRPGLLYDLTSAISDLKLDITSAHITTYGEKAVDVFYVTDLTNKKIIDPNRQKAIKSRLEQVLENAEGAAA
jgi:[protein-PII] uridylyltransferase